MELGKYLKMKRKEKGLSQGAICKAIGVTQTYLSLIETGKSNGTLELWQKIADALQIPLGVMMFMSMNTWDMTEDQQRKYNILAPMIEGAIKEIFYE